MFKLSTFHRYSIVVLALIIVAALFWPTDESTNNHIAQNQPIVIPPATTPEVAEPITTVIEEPETTPDNNQTIPLTTPQTIPEIIPEPIEQPELTPPSKPIEPKTTRPSANEWQNYRVQKGKTLAQLFRDNSLLANDTFVMARVEGAEKPLSNLQQGQKIRLKANAKGEVQLLEISTPEGKTYSFAKLSDGSYYRTP